jgi:CBS domain-containing protein
MGGNGSRLSGRRIAPRLVGELMRRHPATVSPQLSLHELKALYERYDVGTLPVVDEQGVLRGVVGVLDLFKVVRPAGSRWIPDARALWARRVEDIMTRGVMTMDPRETVTAAIQLMVDYKLESVPVVAGSSRASVLVGTLAAKDVLRCVIIEDHADD